MAQNQRRPPTRQVTLSQRLRYRFDNGLAKGLGPMIGLLALVTLGVVILAGLILWIGDVDLNGERAKGIEGIWASLLRTLDPGTMGSDRGWRFRLTSLVVTVAGIFIVSTLIGILANGLGQRIEELRRGRSEVIETGHTLLLGWSPKVFLIIREIAETAAANEHPCVVVLAERDMVEMEDQFRQTFGNSTKVRLVSRTGSPSSPQDLARVAPHQARSVVVLRDEANGDAAAVRTVLALDHLGLDRSVPIVIELADALRANALAAASSLSVVPVVSNDWIATVTARAVFTPSLTDIYEDLLNFAGAEVYFVDVPAMFVGRSLHSACEAVTGGAPFGLRNADKLTIAPPAHHEIAVDDQILVVADTHGDVTFRAGAETSSITAANNASSHLALPTPEPAHLLVLGWSELGSRVLDLLDQSVAPGSQVDIVAPPDAIGTLPSRPFQRFTLRHTVGSSTDADTLRRALSSGSVTRVLVLSSRSSYDPTHHDADALLTVLELRHLLGPNPDVQVTVEITNPDSVDLVRRDASEEFIVGERLVGLLMSQVSQTPGVMDVLRSLLAEDETDFRLLPAETVLEGRASMSGTEAAAILRRHGHYLIGAGHKRGLRLHARISEIDVSPGMQLVTLSRSTQD